jgi:HAD superfamily hydrolase (TIGR01484 family)
VRFTVLACDYDGTIATSGRVDDTTAWDLARLRTSGRHLVLVTGRPLSGLQSVCPHLDLFDLVVVENGGVLYRPTDRAERTLAAAPPEALIERLEKRHVPIEIGHTVVFTWRPHETAAIEEIAALGLGHQVILNRQAVMVAPPGVTKGTALLAALDELGLSPHNTVAVGDAENDHDLLDVVGCGVAVGDAVPALRERADHVSSAPGPQGARELVAALLDDDLASLRIEPRSVALGRDDDGGEVAWQPLGAGLLIIGRAGSGKSTLVASLIECLLAARYQVVVIDPEGDFDGVPGSVAVGDPGRAPPVDEVVDLVEAGTDATVACLLALSIEERPGYVGEMLGRLAEVASRLGRPHAVILDEAHHAFPLDATGDVAPLPEGLVLVSNAPDHLQRELLARIEMVVAVGDDAPRVLGDVADAVGAARPSITTGAAEAVAWWIPDGQVTGFDPVPTRHERRRHSAKWVSGDAGDGQRLVITGPEGALSLEVRNLSELVRIAEGVDEPTWCHHTEHGDWSSWVREVVGDSDLADSIRDIEAQDLDPQAGRRALREAVVARYPDVGDT